MPKKSSIDIRFDESRLCEAVSFIEPEHHSYALNSTMTVSDDRLGRDREILITQVDWQYDNFRAKQTMVSGFTLEYLYTRKAPKVPITFMTLSSDEYSEFVARNPLFSRLEYIPLLSIGIDEYGCGGWTLYSVVEKIAKDWMEIDDLIINLPDYDIKSFTIEPSTTLFSAINTLVSAFEPIIMLQNSILYILERSGAGMMGKWSTEEMSRLSIERQYDPEPGCLLVQGQEGEYLASRDARARSTKINDWLGDYETYSGSSVLPDESKEEFTCKERHYWDQYEQKWALESSTITTIATPPLEDVPPVATKKVQKITYYDGELEEYSAFGSIYRKPDTLDCFTYDTPVEWSQTNESYVGYGPSLNTWGLIHKENIKYDYEDDWTLRSQITSTDILFEFSWTGWKIVDGEKVEGTKNWEEPDWDKKSITDFYDSFGDLKENAAIHLQSIEKITYKPLTRNSYGVATTTTTYSWSQEKDEWVAEVTTNYQIVQAGGTQQNKPTRRTMGVYAGDCLVYAANLGEGESVVMPEPARVLSIPTPSWQSIQECANFLTLYDYQYGKAGFETFGIDPVFCMAVDNLGEIAGSGTIGNYYATGYSVRIDREGQRTTMDCEARLA